MSIQAGWNSALYNLGLISALGDTKKKIGEVGQTVENAQRNAERRAQATDPNFVGPPTAGQQQYATHIRNAAQELREQERQEEAEFETQQREAYEESERAAQTDDYVARRVAEQREDIALGIAGRMTPQEAARRASIAAREADAAPRNTIDGARQALADDPMEALRTMTNEQMGAMDRMAQDRRSEMTGGGN